MSGKCSSTCLQFIINFFKTVTKLRERGPVPAQPSLFRGADVTVCVLLCLFTCFLSASRSLRKHVLPKGPASAFFVCRRRAALLAYKHLFKRADGAALLGRENCPPPPPPPPSVSLCEFSPAQVLTLNTFQGGAFSGKNKNGIGKFRLAASFRVNCDTSGSRQVSRVCD